MNTKMPRIQVISVLISPRAIIYISSAKCERSPVDRLAKY